ncbi:hypothetical protein HDU98_003831 [Podochytrium sp. JEL0797]|nr:hypothetical protein HDU98_003831 [Podochytrium sp. JEL0797]
MAAVATSNPYNAECGAVMQPIFDTCARNGLYNPFTMQFAESIPAFCEVKKSEGDFAYYSCLCAQAKTIVLCYTVNCPGDVTNMNTAIGYEQSTCADMDKFAPTSTTAAIPAATSGPVLPLPSAAPSGSAAPATSGAAVETSAAAAGTSAPAVADSTSTGAAATVATQSATVSVEGGAMQVAAGVVAGVVALIMA